MDMSSIPFGTTDWSQVERTEHRGERGTAFWRTRVFGGIRVRMVEYTPGYLADHWCVKGHILLCTEGELHTELRDGRIFTLGMGGIVTAFDAASGKQLWQKPAGSTLPSYGTAMSPLVDRGRVIVHVGGHNQGALTAFDAAQKKQIMSTNLQGLLEGRRD